MNPTNSLVTYLILNEDHEIFVLLLSERISTHIRSIRHCMAMRFATDLLSLKGGGIETGSPYLYTLSISLCAFNQMAVDRVVRDNKGQ